MAISSNDIENHPDDRPELMQNLLWKNHLTFHLYDPTQEVALAYKASCTPDFYLFDQDLKLAYRGRFDNARPKNDNPYRKRFDELPKIVKGAHKKPDTQLGCNIKWKAGNEPMVFCLSKSINSTQKSSCVRWDYTPAPFEP